MEAEVPGQQYNAQIGGSEYERALLNLLEDSSRERAHLGEVEHALLNILNDSTIAAKHLGETQRALINILYDYDVEKREAERANRALVQSECLAAIGEMASMVSHELRGSLAVMTNVQHLIHQGVGTESLATLESYFGTIDREIDKAKRIAEDLLGYARMRAPEPQTLNLEQVCAELMEVAPPPDGVEVRVDTSGTVVADRVQLGEVLVNLVTNAYDAMPDGGVVSLKAEYDISSVLLLIDDTGTGIDPRIADTLFNPFVSTKQRGTGLGLSIVKRIVDAHSGSITVGPAPGGGTRFTVRFPLSAPERDTPPR